MAKPLDHPFPQRMFHWINLLSMLVLIPTGIYIHRPFVDGYMSTARSLHFVFMYIILFNIILRLYYAFLGKYKDASSFALSTKDLPVLWKTIKAYVFVGHVAHDHKYNPLQKITYIMYIPLIGFQFFTGLLLYRPDTFRGMIENMGGLAQLKSIHYLFMWIFISFVIVHLYMTLTETIDEVKLMLFGVANEQD